MYIMNFNRSHSHPTVKNVILSHYFDYISTEHANLCDHPNTSGFVILFTI